MRDPEGSLVELRRVAAQTGGTLKTTTDLARYDWVIENCDVDIVVETGLYHGGSARWFAKRVRRVISVEQHYGYVATARATGLPANVTIIDGYSGDPDVIDRVRRELDALPGLSVMVSLDSAHSDDNVSIELAAYADFVTSGSYLVVEDGTLDLMPEPERHACHVYGGTPLDAIRFFLLHRTDFVSDQRLEDMFPTTLHMGGWLRHDA